MRARPTPCDQHGRPLPRWRRVGPTDLRPLIQERERQRQRQWQGQRQRQWQGQGRGQGQRQWQWQGQRQMQRGGFAGRAAAPRRFG